jgi:biopolymer transport protein ExbD/biopolymer transport protein TolR
MAMITRNGAKVNSSINVTPMVDVMLVLLIIFMVITPMLKPDPHVDEMARTNNPIDLSGANKADALIVAVARDGRVFLGNEMINSIELTNRVKEQLARRNDRTIYVRADARSRYKFVVEAVDNVRAAGADELGLLTEKREHGVARE